MGLEKVSEKGVRHDSRMKTLSAVTAAQGWSSVNRLAVVYAIGHRRRDERARSAMDAQRGPQLGNG